MRFSIIIPIHVEGERRYSYRKDFFRLAESINEQSFKDFEVLLVFDKCPESTIRATYIWLENYKFNYRGFVCENGNAGLTRNVGLEIAHGEYILFADDDDYILHPYVFEEIDRVITANNNPDIIHFGFIFGSNGYVYPTWNDGHLYGNVWSKCYKRSAIGDTRFPNVYPDDDLQFNKLMEQKDLRHVLCDAPIYYYNYMREGSITWNEKQKK